MANVIKRFPVTERGYGVRCVTKNGRHYAITHCPEKERFTLWNVNENGYLKVEEAKTPYQLYKSVPWSK